MQKPERRTRRHLTIGAFAEQAGVGVETVRYYQRRGLLDKPSRPAAGNALYTDAMLARMAFIRRAQGLGFTLEEIRTLLALSQRECASGRLFVKRKLEELEARLAELNRMRSQLNKIAAKCDQMPATGPCPFLQLLNEPGTRKAR